MSSGATQHTGQRSQENEQTSTGAGNRVSSVMRYLRRGSSSGLFAGIAGLVTVRRVRRALREGSSERATRQAVMAVFWIGVAMTQWEMNRSGGRHRNVEATDVVDTAPDIAEISSGSNADEASGDSTSIDVTERNPAPSVEGVVSDADGDENDVVGTEPNVEDVVDAEGIEQAEDAEGMEDVEDVEGVTDLHGTADAEDEDEEAG